jgi:hypothetical protein
VKLLFDPDIGTYNYDSTKMWDSLESS